LAKPADCPTLIKNFDAGDSASLNSNYTVAGMIAHSIHSLTIQDIDYYFPNDKDDIVMPVANPDLLSPEPILFRPPNFEYSFKNPAFRAIELVLSNMNNPNYGAKYYTDLEKLVHTAHMQDIWTEGGLAYAKLQKSEAFDYASLCPCINHVENNGVLEELKKLTLKKYLVVTSGLILQYLFQLLRMSSLGIFGKLDM